VHEYLFLLLLRSERMSGMCAKLHTVAATSNRHHMPWSLYYCLFAPDIYGCCSSRTSRSWWIAYLTQCQRRSCYNIPSFLQRSASIARSFCEVCTWSDIHILVTAPFLLRSESPSGVVWKRQSHQWIFLFVFYIFWWKVSQSLVSPSSLSLARSPSPLSGPLVPCQFPLVSPCIAHALYALYVLWRFTCGLWLSNSFHSAPSGKLKIVFSN